MYWRKYERTEKEQRRKAEREAVEQRKIDDEMREVCPPLPLFVSLLATLGIESRTSKA